MQKLKTKRLTEIIIQSMNRLRRINIKKKTQNEKTKPKLLLVHLSSSSSSSAIIDQKGLLG